MFDPQYYPFASRRNLVYAHRGMVASSHPLASQAGLQVLQSGGNAVDAALAMAAALPVVDPANNGVGGDCFAIVSFRGEKLAGLNSSGFSPALLTRERVLAAHPGAKAMPKRGWLPVTVPGAPAGWAALHERYATKSLPELFAPAIALARGYALSPDNAPILNACTALFSASEDPVLRRWTEGFNPTGRTFRAGDLYALPEMGRTLQRLAESRCRDLYEGDLAARIDAYARESGGLMRGEDLAAFAPRWVDPICTAFRGCEVYELPPNGQGMTALLALNILEALPLSGANEVDRLHMMMEAMKLAFADALHYIADPGYMRVSPESLLSKDYARARAACITDRARVYAPGEPLRGDTVYFCAADGEGNSISMIQSLYEGFGSGVLVPGTGICLQNRGACFSLAEGHANVVAPRKYPYHTIIPGFLTRDGKPLGPFGIMGGYMQPQAHMQVLVHLLDEGHNPQAALDAPRFCWTEGLRFDMEPGFSPAVVDALRRRGHEIRVLSGSQYGRGQMILRAGESWAGATEPRADGSVIGF